MFILLVFCGGGACGCGGIYTLGFMTQGGKLYWSVGGGGGGRPGGASRPH